MWRQSFRRCVSPNYLMVRDSDFPFPHLHNERIPSKSSNVMDGRCFSCTAPFKHPSVELLSPHTYWIGRLSCCQPHLCHLSCSAASCSSCDKTRVYSGLKNNPSSIWPSADQWDSAASLSVSPSRPMPDESVWKSLFFHLQAVKYFQRVC